MFSEGTQEVFRQWQKGGASQKDVINEIVSDIQNAQNQQEAMTMASTAFGTLAEDANLGVIESLTTMGDSYSDVAGAAQEMSDNTTTPMQEMQKSINDLQLGTGPIGQIGLNLATKYLPQVINVIVGLIEKFMSLSGPVKTIIGVLAGVIAVLSALMPVLTAVVTIVGFSVGGVLLPLAAAIGVVTGVITGIILAIQNWGNITEWLGKTWEKIKDTGEN